MFSFTILRIQDLSTLCKIVLQDIFSAGQASSQKIASPHHCLTSSESHLQPTSSVPSKSYPANSVFSPSSSSASLSTLSSTPHDPPKATKSIPIIDRTLEQISRVEPPQALLCEEPSGNHQSGSSSSVPASNKSTDSTSLNELSKGPSSAQLPDSRSRDKLQVDQANATQSELPSESLTFLQLHDFGCTLDDTELPHHLSSQPQVGALMVEVKAMLESLPRPALVTIAR